MEIMIIVPRNEVVVVENGVPQYVEGLTDGEKLVEVGSFNHFIKPKYDDVLNDFIESATPEEMDTVKDTPKIISEEEKANDLLKIIALNIMNNDELLKTFGIEPRPTA